MNNEDDEAMQSGPEALSENLPPITGTAERAKRPSCFPLRMSVYSSTDPL